MMKIFRRSTTTKIYAVTPLEYYASEVLVEPAMKFFPKWFKDSAALYKKKLEQDSPTERDYITSFHKCPGVVELYKKGYMVPCPVDTYFEFSEDGQEIRWSMGPNEGVYNIELMEKEKTGIPNLGKGYYRHVVKLSLPIKFYCEKPNQYLYFFPVPYADNNLFQATPGLLDLDLSEHLNIQTIMRSDQGVVCIKKGDPLVHLIPNDDKAEIVNKRVDHELWEGVVEGCSTITLATASRYRSWNRVKEGRRRLLSRSKFFDRLNKYK